MPFYGRKRRHIVEQILNCQYDFRGRRWKRISQQAKNFIEGLLVFDPEERLEAATALSCTWLNKRFAATTRAPDEEEETMARHAMLRYAGYTKLKKMALMIVAHKSTCEEIGILRKVFEKYDSRRDGQISYEEFSGALSESGHSPDDLRAMFEAVVSFENKLPCATGHTLSSSNLILTETNIFSSGSGWFRTNTIYGVFGCHY